MRIFGKNINNYIDEFKAEEDTVLVDVREADEYASGRIPGSINVPLSDFDRIEDEVPDKVPELSSTVCQVVVVTWRPHL